MPARSKAQQSYFALCAHGIARDQCPEHMSVKKMREFAKTPRKGLPERAPKRK